MFVVRPGAMVGPWGAGHNRVPGRARTSLSVTYHTYSDPVQASVGGEGSGSGLSLSPANHREAAYLLVGLRPVIGGVGGYGGSDVVCCCDGSVGGC